MKSGFRFIVVTVLLALVSCQAKNGATSIVSGGNIVSSLENQEFCTVSTLNKDVVFEFGAFSGSSADIDFIVNGASVGTLSGSLSGSTFDIQSGSVTMYGMSVTVSEGQIAFLANAATGSGSFTLDVFGDAIEMSIELTKGACAHDVLAYAGPLPANLISVNYMSLDNMKSISKFRSGAGHDFIDDFESCRSMKHYYSFLDSLDAASRDAEAIYSPFAGVISAVSIEPMGTTVHIRSSANPYLWVEIFHVELNSSLEVGTTLSAGQQIGTHFAYNGDGGNSDIAVWVRRPDGYRLISQFEIMSAGVLAEFTARGVTDWSTDLYFEDDSVLNPHLGAGGLQCSDQEFTSGTDDARDYFQLL